MDQESNELEEDIINLQIKFNPEISKKHVGEIERMIQLYKEIIHRLPFQKIPRVMVCEMGEDAITWMNNIPPKCGISEHISPQMIITVTPFYYKKQCKF